MALLASCRTPKKAEMAEMVKNKKFIGDMWETIYGAHALKPNVNHAYGVYQPTGDIENDFTKFTMLQGGGKSVDPYDNANNYKPPVPDVDGSWPHTVHDITWPFFCTWAPKAGIPVTAQRFYDMTEDEHGRMVDEFIKEGLSIFNIKSDAVGMVYLYTSWGSGIGDGIMGNGRHDYGARDLMDYYRQFYGMTVNESIDTAGEYITFFNSLVLRREQMKRETSSWHRYNVNWSSGLAHFHRIMKNYCKS